jgi:hypothetical protein
VKALYSVEEPIYSFETSNPYTDEISNRQRRSLNGSKKGKLQAARQAQEKAGFRLRISRSVLNHQDFGPELKTWIPFVQAGLASRKSLGNLSITLFDTNQQPLRHNNEGFGSEDELLELLQDRRPELFVRTPPIKVTGISLFGNESEPFVGLRLEPGFIYDELGHVRRIVAPELSLDRSHQLEHLPHVTVGQATRPESVEAIQVALRTVLPDYVQFTESNIDYQTSM